MALEVTPPQSNSPEVPPVGSGPTTKSRNVAIIIIVVLVVMVVFAAIWFTLKSLATTDTDTTTRTATPTKTSTESAEIKSDSDLKKVEDELNNTNIDDLESDLEQNDTDAAQF